MWRGDGVVAWPWRPCIQGNVSGRMDVCSIYACPIGAPCMGGVFFYWKLV
ncbi:MAG: hypothetical protein ACLTG0_08250 [Oscillibacter sp.]